MRLMIIGHLEGHISAAGKIALQRGAKVVHCDDYQQALGALRNGKGADVVMIDVKQNIAAFIEALNAERFAIPVVACGVGADGAAAVKAIKAGAKEYVPLPPDPDLIAAVIEAVTEDQTSMIASDPAMQKVLKLADQVAPSEATVMITGESGTGKEVMSRHIHKKSKRKDGPFIALNCAAIPENLLESELFGHEKGAFTGAVGRRIGKFEEATGGTLLLDEVSEMHPSLQAKLLRAIQERVIDRIGGKEPVKINVRIIATSNRNLKDSVAKGDFREDLYFRLNVVNIHLPPLRERKGDLVPLAQFYVDKYAEVNGVPKKKLSKAAQTKILGSDWRGNVRELENAMHRAILISGEDEIEADAVIISDEAAVATAAPASKIGSTVADMEKKLILDTLDHVLGNRTTAAKILGISIRTLRNKLKEYGQEP
ncbi:MAG: sigma-54-dependent Fis family transcriptional regulator [Proteobacteria bacterium]|nr:sigma-54-dependent Fis family transcriptional regulator [Pseudomonadota bacterium]